MSIRPLLGVSLVALLLTACGESTPEESGSSESRGAVKQADEFIAQQTIDTSKRMWKTKLPQPPTFEFDAEDTYYWVLKTNHGTMRFKLRPDVAPMHVSSTIYLTRLGFYDDVPFHRVVRDFMAQGGDPLGRGSGGPGYEYGGEFSPDVRHDRPGLLSMANSGPGTDGSQFFITFKETPWLDDKHTIFGEIAEGQDVVQKLNGLARGEGSRDTSPTKPLRIEQASIEVE